MKDEAREAAENIGWLKVLPSDKDVEIYLKGFAAGYEYANREQAAEIERLRAEFRKFLNEVDEHNASFYGQGVARIFTIEARAALGGSDD